MTNIFNLRPLAAIAVVVALSGCAYARAGVPIAASSISSSRDAQARARYKFRPPSPLSMTLNTTLYVTISESGYSGPFKVSGCSGKNCAKGAYGWACWTRSTPDDINSITAQIKASPTMIMTEYAAGQYYPSVQCTFTIKDTKGRTATYEAFAPGSGH